MRKLLNTLFVINEDAYLTLDGENLVVTRNKQETHRYALHTLEGIVCFTYAGASPALMGACARQGIDLCFFDPYGRFQARTVGEERGNVLLRQTQYRVSDDPAQSCRYARSFILGKVYNARWVLERATRDHPQRVPVVFEGRSRRPPLDNVNALLSFAYSMLARECASALTAVGLDPYVGFMHRPRPGRKSLALDLMEELRAVYADRLVISCINQKIITAKHLQKQENGAVLLTDDGRKAFLTAWQNKKKEEITHPFLKEKLPWGLVPYVQALLLARALRGDLEVYPPFFWK